MKAYKHNGSGSSLGALVKVTVAARDAEIERLARRVAIADVNLGLCADEANRLRAEVERLRKALGLVLTSRSEAE